MHCTPFGTLIAVHVMFIDFHSKGDLPMKDVDIPLPLPPSISAKFQAPVERTAQHGGSSVRGQIPSIPLAKWNKNPHSWGQSVIIKLVLSSPPSLCWLALIYIHIFISRILWRSKKSLVTVVTASIVAYSAAKSPTISHYPSNFYGRIIVNMISHYIPLYPTLSHYIPLYPTISHFIPLYTTLSHFIPLYPTISHFILYTTFIPLYPTLSPYPWSYIVHTPLWCFRNARWTLVAFEPH